MKKLLFFLFISLPLSFQAQVSITDQSSLGSNGTDLPADIVSSPDGGYFVLMIVEPPLPSGNITESGFGNGDFLLVKYDNNNNILWQKIFGGSEFDNPEKLLLIGNELFLIGTSSSPVSGNKTAVNLGSSDVWIVKTDLDGNIIWDKTFGGTDQELCKAVNQLDNGNLLIASMSYSGISGNKTSPNIGLGDYWVFELDENGEYVWENTIGSDGIDEPSDIKEYENNIYITGVSQGGATGDKTEPLYGFADYWVMKTNATGSLIWNKAIGTNEPDMGSSKLHIDNDSIQVFNTGSNPMSGMRNVPQKGTQDIWRVSLSHDGDILSQKSYGGDDSESLYGFYELNGNLLLLSNSNSDISIDKTENSKGGRDFWPILLDQNGEILWQKTIGGNQDDVFTRVLMRSNNRLLLCGYSLSDVSGDKTTPNYGDNDTWIVELDITSLSNENFDSQDFTVYPNPFQDNIILSGENLKNVEKVEVIDAMGKVVASKSISATFNNTISISTEDVASGSYIVNVISAKGVQSYKMVK